MRNQLNFKFALGPSSTISCPTGTRWPPTCPVSLSVERANQTLLRGNPQDQFNWINIWIYPVRAAGPGLQCQFVEDGGRRVRFADLAGSSGMIRLADCLVRC